MQNSNEERMARFRACTSEQLVAWYIRNDRVAFTEDDFAAMRTVLEEMVVTPPVQNDPLWDADAARATNAQRLVGSTSEYEPNRSFDAFESLQGMTRIVRILLLAQIALGVVCALFPARWPDPAVARPSSLEALGMFLRPHVILFLVISLAGFVLSLIWIFRAVDNLSPLRVENPRFSPGWAVGWHFIPIFNLFRPFQIMRELGRGSIPVLEGWQSPLRRTFVMLVGIWWALELLPYLLAIVTSGTEGGGSMRYLPDQDPLSLLTFVFSSAAALLFIKLIGIVQVSQQARIDELRRLAEAPRVAG